MFLKILLACDISEWAIKVILQDFHELHDFKSISLLFTEHKNNR